MEKRLQNIDNFHCTQRGKITFGAIEVLAAYLLASRAIDTGSLWQYGFSFLFFIGGVNNIIRVFTRSDTRYEKAKRRR